MTGNVQKGENSDRIGKLGEIEFERLCNLAKLNCSKVEPDRTGKDFIVEFQLPDPNEKISYDMRAAPQQVIAQVKTISERSDQVRVAMSTAERLSKDLRPAIIYIFKIDQSNNFKSMHFIELIDKNLEKVLKRLRQESQKQNAKLHKAEMSFRPSHGRSVDINPAAMYAHMASLASPSMEEYAAKKTDQLNSLGFDEHRYNLKITFDRENENDIAEGMLGLKPLKVSEHVETEIRFDIPLPHTGLLPSTSGAIIHVTPNADLTGMLVATDLVTGNEASISADLLITRRSLMPNTQKALFRWGSGSIIIDFKSQEYNVNVKLDADKELSPSAWIAELQFLSALLNKGCKLSFRSRKPNYIFGNITPTGNSINVNFDEKIALISIVNNIFISGDFVDKKISLRSAYVAYNSLRVLDSINSHNTKFSTRLDNVPFEGASKSRGLFISAFQIGIYWIGFSIPIDVSVENNYNNFVWTGLKSGEASYELLSGSTMEEFDKFRNRTMRISNTQCAFMQGPGDFLSENQTLIELDS